MWPADYELSDAQLALFDAQLNCLRESLDDLADEIAAAEMLLPHSQPGPFCGFLRQAALTLTLASDAVGECRLHRLGPSAGGSAAEAQSAAAADLRPVSGEATGSPPTPEPVER